MPTPESQPATGLVIDDEPGRLALPQAVLQDAGFAPTCVTQIHPALEEFARRPFDVLVIDQWVARRQRLADL